MMLLPVSNRLSLVPGKNRTAVAIIRPRGAVDAWPGLNVTLTSQMILAWADRLNESLRELAEPTARMVEFLA
jgi:hypothetical protein